LISYFFFLPFFFFLFALLSVRVCQQRRLGSVAAVTFHRLKPTFLLFNSTYSGYYTLVHQTHRRHQRHQLHLKGPWPCTRIIRLSRIHVLLLLYRYCVILMISKTFLKIKQYNTSCCDSRATWWREMLLGALYNIIIYLKRVNAILLW